MLASDVTWSDYVEYVISKVNQRLDLFTQYQTFITLKHSQTIL